MGTRGLLGFIIRGQRKGCYVQFDSYPEGLGAEIIIFILSLSPEQRLLMRQRLEEIEWIEDSEDDPPADIKAQYRALQFHLVRIEQLQLLEHASSPERNWGRQHILEREQRPLDWWELLRGVQGAICLPLILDGSLRHLIDSTEFVEDGLFCEFDYWIDFDKCTFTSHSFDVGKDVDCEELGDYTFVWPFDKLEQSKTWREIIASRRRIYQQQAEGEARYIGSIRQKETREADQARAQEELSTGHGQAKTETDSSQAEEPKADDPTAFEALTSIPTARALE